jgi:hypothetical protein
MPPVIGNATKAGVILRQKQACRYRRTPTSDSFQLLSAGSLGSDFKNRMSSA